MIFKVQYLDRYDNRDVIAANLLDSYERKCAFVKIIWTIYAGTYKSTKLYSGDVLSFVEGDIFKTIILLIDKVRYPWISFCIILDRALIASAVDKSNPTALKTSIVHQALGWIAKHRDYLMPCPESHAAFCLGSCNIGHFFASSASEISLWENNPNYNEL